MVNIWFDGWFSSAYNIIELIKKNPENRPFKIIGSHYKDMVYKVLCDEWFQRPDFKETEMLDCNRYIEWAIDMCRKNKVDIFIPKKFLSEIAYVTHEFDSIGVKVMVPEYTTVKQLESKVGTYGLLCTIDNIIPPISVLSNSNSIRDFEKFLNNKDFKYDNLCIKPEFGTGAEGIYKINKIQDYLRNQEEINGKGYLIMPWFNGFEISVDFVKNGDNEIFVTRCKTNNCRLQSIVKVEKIESICKEIQSILQLNVPYNIQFKEHNGQLYLLEVNPRMSGGVHLSCLSGINIPYLAVKEILGEKIENIPPIKECNVANYEKGVVV